MDLLLKAEGLEIYGFIDEEEELDEQPCAFSPFTDTISWAEFKVGTTTRYAQRFVISADAFGYGPVTISGQFAKPIELDRTIVVDDRDAERELNWDAVQKAILAKVGQLPFADEIIVEA